MLPGPEDIERVNPEAAAIIENYFHGHLPEYISIGLGVNDAECTCFIGGYPRRHQGGKGGGADGSEAELLCQLETDEAACIDFGNAALEAFIDSETGNIAVKINNW